MKFWALPEAEGGRPYLGLADSSQIQCRSLADFANSLRLYCLGRQKKRMSDAGPNLAEALRRYW
jgi:hypothetical protein